MIKKLLTLALCLNIYNIYAALAIQDYRKVATDALRSAIEKDDMAKAQHAIDKRADVNAKFDGKSLLTIACLNNKKEMVELLLKSGAEVDHCKDIVHRDEDNYWIDDDEVNRDFLSTTSPLLASYFKGNMELVKILINHNNSAESLKELEELTWLLVLSETDYSDLQSDFNQDQKTELINLLLDKLNFMPEYLPVQACFSYGKDRFIGRAICDHPLLINPNEEGLIEGQIEGSLLFIATYVGDFETVKILVKKGADINFNRNFSNESEDIMYAAIASGKFELVKYFLDLGLQINDSNLKGLTNSENTTAARCDIELFEYLLKYYSNQLRQYPLYPMIMRGTLNNYITDENLSKKYNLLRENDFDVFAKNYDGTNALQEVNSISHVKLLMEHGLNVDHEKYGMHSVFIRQFDVSGIKKIFFDLLKFYPIKINNNDINEANSKIYFENHEIIAGLMAKRKRANDNQVQLFNLINYNSKITTDEDAIANLKKFIIDYKISLIAFDDKTGNSTLHHAIFCGKPHIAKFILYFAPALADIPNKDGKIPMDFIPSRDHMMEALFNRKVPKRV